MQVAIGYCDKCVSSVSGLGFERPREFFENGNKKRV